MTTAEITTWTPLDAATLAVDGWRHALATYRKAAPVERRPADLAIAGEAMAAAIARMRLDAVAGPDEGAAGRALVRIAGLLAGPRYPSGGDLAADLRDILRDAGISVD